MTEYWESRFKNEGAMWKFEPSDSALLALDLFQASHIDHILIPGFGYGRNAGLFYEKGFRVTGIEISKSAIELAKGNGFDCKIHHGSVTSMPFDKERFGGIFCYALLHLLNKRERRTFLMNCYHQLTDGGIMIFTIVSKLASMYGSGSQVSKDRFKLTNGLKVFFYDANAVEREFADFGLVEYRDIDEPIKFMVGEAPLKCIVVVCRKESY